MNQFGFEASNEAMCEGRDLPWLQDDATQNVWAAWAVTYRDVIILDEENIPVAVYNLTSQSLAVQANYDALRQLFLDVATGAR